MVNLTPQQKKLAAIATAVLKKKKKAAKPGSAVFKVLESERLKQEQSRKVLEQSVLGGTKIIMTDPRTKKTTVRTSTGTRTKTVIRQATPQELSTAKVDKVVKLKDITQTLSQKQRLQQQKFFKDEKLRRNLARELFMIDTDKKLTASAKDKAKRKLLGTEQFIKITPRQQLLQRQTITPEAKALLAPPPKEEPLSTGITFKLKDVENIKRGIRGERTVQTPFGVMFAKRDGTLRQPSAAERKELEKDLKTTLNPLNIITGFFSGTKEIGQFLSSKDKGAQLALAGTAIVTNPGGVLDNTFKSLVRNPGGFIGESAGGLAAGKIAKVIVKSSKVNVGLNKVKKAVKSEELTIINKINKIKKAGVNVRQRTPQGTELRLLNEELNILRADLFDLDNVIKSASSRPKTLTQATKQVIDIRSATSNIKKRRSKKQNLINKKKKLKTVPLKPVTISKKLGEFFKVEKDIIKVKKQISKDIPKLEVALLEASKVSGEAFSKLKKKIKKEFNLNVVERKKKGKKVFKLLEPKEQRRVGVITGKKAKVKVIELEPPKPKVIEIKPVSKKPTLKELDKLEKQIGLEIKRSKTRPSKFNKKAQAQIGISVRRFYSRASKQISNISKKTKDFNQGYKRRIEKRGKDLPKTKQGFNTLSKSEKKKFMETRKKLREDVKLAKSNLSKVKSLLNKAQKIAVIAKFDKDIKQDILQLSKQDTLLDNSLKQIFDNTGTIPPGVSPTKPPVKPPIKPTPKITPTKPPVKPPVKPKPRPTPPPPEKPPIKPKIKLDWDNEAKLKDKVLIFNARFRQRKDTRKKYNPKTNPRVIKTLKIKDTKNRALAKVANKVDNILARSLDLKLVGITAKKKKDIKAPKIVRKKFDKKKSKGSPVLKLVEKTKHIADRKGEVSSLVRLRRKK